MKVKVVERSAQTIRLVALKNPNAAARPQHPMNLSKPRGIITEIAKTERRGHKVERVIREGKRHRITLNPSHIRSCVLTLCKTKHLPRKIEPRHRFGICCALSKQRSREISGPAANIQNPRIRTSQYLAKRNRRATPPAPIKPKRQQVICPIVRRRNRAEELAHMFRSFGL